ncbi:MAG: Kazal-type serine protease inhibitor domain-containing protein [Polyangiales bacterium]
MHWTHRATSTALGALLMFATTGCPKDPDAPADGGVDAGEGTAGTSGAEAGTGGKAAGSGGSAGKGGRGGAGGVAAAGSGGSAQAGAGGAAEAGSGGIAAAGAGGAAAGSGGAGEVDDDAGAPQGVVCGTRGAAECKPDEFCNFEPDQDCGGTDRGGVCEVKPEVCSEEDQPVCGCDSHTYSNACDAHSAGISVLHTGLCDVAECEAAGGRPVHSDGASTPTCSAGEQQWNIDGGGDEGSVCCLARAEGEICGGFAGLECTTTGQFCNYETSAGGQGCDGMISDASGVCQVIPQACTREYKPVCGCDRHTYNNDCVAHSEAVSLLHDGACTVSDCEALGGRAVAGIGPAPMCADDEHEVTSIVNDDGSIAIEGMICCVKN